MPRPFPHAAADLPAQHVRSLAAPDLGSPRSLVIDGAPEQVSAARAFVRQVLGSRHPGAERVALLTSELVTNSVRHSNSRKDGGTVTVTLRVAADRVLVEVIDDGGATVPTLCRDDDMADQPGQNDRRDRQGQRIRSRRCGPCAVPWFQGPARLMLVVVHGVAGQSGAGAAPARDHVRARKR